MYTPQTLGCLGVPCCEDEMHIARVAQAFKFLADTRDPAVRQVALLQLRSSLRHTHSTMQLSAESASVLCEGTELSWAKRNKVNQVLKYATLNRHMIDLQIHVLNCV